MKPSGTPAAAGDAAKDNVDTEGTGLPGFKTWRAVYIFVLVTYVLCVAFLVALTHAFP